MTRRLSKAKSPADSPTSTQHSPQSKSPTFTQANVTIMGCNETMMDDETVANADVTVLGRGRQKRANNQATIAALLSNELVETKQTENANETLPRLHLVNTRSRRLLSIRVPLRLVL